MLSSGYFAYRWSWYKPVFGRGGTPAARCKVDVLRLPVRMAGKDVTACIPHVLHPSIIQAIAGSSHRAQALSKRYMIDNEKISAHKLPPIPNDCRQIFIHLRKSFPFLPLTLVHHWCADRQGGGALLRTLLQVWEMSFRQERADNAPWLAAVNIRLLALLREANVNVDSKQDDITDYVLQSLIGGTYLFAMQSFLKDNVHGSVEMTRIATYESMFIPATPIVFFHRQPEDSMLADARHIRLAYGLEANLIPMMRELRQKLGVKNESGMLGLLGKDRLGDHLLKRSWARLSLWALAEQSGHGNLMQWVLDAKKLDSLLNYPEKYMDVIGRTVRSHDHNTFARWFTAQVNGGKLKKTAPWRQDDITLLAFRVFEEDMKVEIKRRSEEKLWCDIYEDIVPRGNSGVEANKLLETSFTDGKMVYLQTKDTLKMLHAGSKTTVQQACLKADWSDYLAELACLRTCKMEEFLEAKFMVGLFALLDKHSTVFCDSIYADGCILRGKAWDLLAFANGLHAQLSSWRKEIMGKKDADILTAPTASMCIDTAADWIFARKKIKNAGEKHFVFSKVLPKLNEAIAHDAQLGRKIMSRNRQLGTQQPGYACIMPLKLASGNDLRLLYNRGLLLTDAAHNLLRQEIGNRHKVRQYSVKALVAQSILPSVRLPEKELNFIYIEIKNSSPYVIIRLGNALLANEETSLHEVLDPMGQAWRYIRQEGIARWKTVE
ncbi:MAG: hypothetical protein R8K21_03340 [Mariprofundales bacterium]